MHSTQENKAQQLLSIEDLSVEFLSGETVQRAVNNISFSILKGETLALVGESGSGKSVTAHSILRLLPYPLARHPSGKIMYQGEDLLAATPEYLRNVRGNRIAMIFQEPMSSLNPLHTIEKQINESDYTAMDIAAAFLKQALGQINLDNDREDSFDFDNTGAEEGMVRLFINIGKKDRVKPGDILGAVAGESGMPGKLVGAIDMYDKYTFVEVPREYGKEVLEAKKNAKIKGGSVNMEPTNKK